MKTLILSDGRVVGPKHDSSYSKLWRVDLLHNFKVTEKDRVIVGPLSFDVCCEFFKGFSLLLYEPLGLF